MKIVSLIVIFFLCFSLEIQMKAVSPSAVVPTDDAEKDIVSDPSGCLLHLQFPCSIKMRSSHEKNGQWLGHQIQLEWSSQSLFELVSINKIRFISGKMIVVSPSESTVWIHTSYGDIALNESTIMITRSHFQSPFEITVLRGEAVIYPLAEEAITLPIGFQNWLGPIQEKNQSSSSIPQAAKIQQVLENWRDLHQVKRSQFTLELKEFINSWQSAVQNASVWHKTLYERRLASVAKEKALKAWRKAQTEKERQEIRDLFLHKNHLDE